MPRTGSRAAALAALFAVAELLLAGCGARASGPPDTLRWSFNLPTSWDPVTSSTGNDINTLSLTYASLTQLDAQGTAVPGLAASWRYNGDGTAVTFTLRPGLAFTDGTPCDADAVRRSLLRGKTQQDSLVKDQLATIRDITVDGPDRVNLALAAPDYQVPNLLAGKTGEIVSPAAFTRDAAGLRTHPVGAGPFRMVSFVPEAGAVLVRNPGYWDAANIRFDRLELSVPTDSSSIIPAVQTGSVDVALINGTQVAQARAVGLDVDVIDSLTVNQVDVHSGLAPLTDRRVVEALKYAVDRQAIINLTGGGIGQVTYQPFPRGYVAYDPALDRAYPYDPARARAMLAAAGYPPTPLTLTITVNAVTRSTAEVVQQQLQAVGVQATIKVVPLGSSTWQQQVYLGRKAQFALDSTVGRESPVQNLGVVYGPTGLMNTSKVATPDFLAALDAVRRTPLDSPAYPAVLRAAVAAGVAMSPSFALGTLPRIVVRSPRVSPLPHVLSQYRWEGVTVLAQPPGAQP